MKHFRAIALAVVLCLCMSITAFAADSGDKIYDANGSDYPVLCNKDSGQFNVVDYISDHPSYTVAITHDGVSTYLFIYKGMRMTVNENNRLVAQTAGDVDMFKLASNRSVWNYYTSLTIDSGQGYLVEKSHLRIVSKDVVDASGETVATQHERFHKALPVVILEVTEEQMEKTLPEVFGTMGLLTASAVGLMALVASLRLFGKRSLIFRN